MLRVLTFQKTMKNYYNKLKISSSSSRGSYLFWRGPENFEYYYYFLKDLIYSFIVKSIHGLCKIHRLSKEKKITVNTLMYTSQDYYVYRQYVIFIFFFFLSFSLLRATRTVHGGCQAKGPIGAVATSLHQGHSNSGSKPSPQPTPQLMGTLDP